MNTTNTITVEDLKRFCSTDETRLPINHPFSQGAWTYFTDGRIILRIPRASEVPEYDDAPKIEERNIFSEITNQWQCIPKDIPSVKTVECEACHGDRQCECKCGNVHTCELCEGHGKYEETKGELVQIGRQFASHLYLNKIKTLPGIQICESAVGKNSSLGLRFDGGEGRLMPMRND